MTALVAELERWGGDVCVFAGDALIVLFEGEGSAARATRAAAEVRHWIGANGTRPDVRRPGHAPGVDRGRDRARRPRPRRRRRRRPDAVPRRADDDVGRADGARGGRRRGHGRRGHGRGRRPDRSCARDGRAASLLRRVQPPGRARRAGPGPARRRRDAARHPAAPPVPARRRGALESEHRQATIAFVLAGGLDERLAAGADGAASVAADLDAWFGAACEAGERHGVTVLDTDATADGAVLFLAAGAPLATGEEDERMLRALRDILAIPEAARLGLRAGTNRGPGVRGRLRGADPADLHGDGRHDQPRGADRAQRGARPAARDRGRARPLRDRVRRRGRSRAFTAKGKAEPVVPYEVGRPAGPGPGPAAGCHSPAATRSSACSGTPSPAPAAGRGGLVEIVGEAGVRQVAARRRAARRAGRRGAARRPLLHVRGRDALRRGPGRPARARRDRARRDPGRGRQARLAAWVADLLPDAAPWLPLIAIPFGAEVAATTEVDSLAPAFRRDRLHAELAAAAGRGAAAGRRRAPRGPPLGGRGDPRAHRRAGRVAAGRGPAAARAPPPRARRRSSRSRSRRSSSRASRPRPWRASRCEAADRPLSDADLAGIVARASGNPLFARELAEVAAATGSVDRLPGAPRVAGREPDRPPRPARPAPAPPRRRPGRVVDVDLLAEAVADAADARDARDLGALERPRRVRRVGRARRSSGSATTSSATRPMRASRTRAGTSLHRTLALTIERRAGDDTDPVAAELATHFAEGELPEPAFRYARRAGDLARALYANVDAAALYRRAMASAALVRDLPPVDRRRRRGVAGRRRRARGAVPRGPGAYDRARRLHRRNREPLDVAAHADAAPTGPGPTTTATRASTSPGSRARAGS